RELEREASADCERRYTNRSQSKAAKVKGNTKTNKKADKLAQSLRQKYDDFDRVLHDLRAAWLGRARDMDPKELRHQMLEHLHNEEKAIMNRYRRWTTAQFEEIAVLGKGSFGTVHLVRCKVDKKLYALKRVGKSQYKRKNRGLAFTERDALMHTSHTWCAQLMCTFQDEDNLFFAMEFMQGGNLSTHLERCGRFTLQTTAFYMAELIEAVDAVHACGQVHRDLKPA
ncbi:unnamed protein product, partial [Effrenium voratum]